MRIILKAIDPLTPYGHLSSSYILTSDPRPHRSPASWWFSEVDRGPCRFEALRMEC